MLKKGLLFASIISIVFISCENSSDKEKLEADKAKIESEINEKKAKLAEINDQLAAFDTVTLQVLPKVKIASAKTSVFEHYFEAQGNLEAENAAVLTPENGGKVVSISVKEGQTVSAGSTIATFDQSVISSNIKELDKNLELAKYMYEKQQSLFDQGVGTELQLKQAKTQYEALKQTKASLSTQAGKFVLKAPFSGYIEEVFVVKGEVAGPMSPIVRIVNTDKLKVVGTISEVYLKDLDNDASVDVIFPALQDTLPNQNINRMGKFINPANRTVNVEVNVPSKEKFIPNLMAVLKVRDFVDTAALTIPNQAVLEDNKGNAFVFRIDDNNIATKTIITVANSYNQTSMITSGLKPNDKVVIQGARKLVSGQKIEVE